MAEQDKCPICGAGLEFKKRMKLWDVLLCHKCVKRVERPSGVRIVKGRCWNKWKVKSEPRKREELSEEAQGP